MGLLDGILGNVLGGVAGNLGGQLGSVLGGNLGGNASGGSGSFGGQQGDDNPLGQILGRLGGGSGIGKMAFLALAFQLLQRSGGISGLVDKLRQSGLGEHADSWVGTGSNLPVSGDQVKNAIGPEIIDQLAKRFNLSPDQASNGLAQVLPELVNQMTPQGAVPGDQHDMISDALNALAPHT